GSALPPTASIRSHRTLLRHATGIWSIASQYRVSAWLWLLRGATLDDCDVAERTPIPDRNRGVPVGIKSEPEISRSLVKESTGRTHRFELLLLQSFLRVDWPRPPCCSITAAAAAPPKRSIARGHQRDRRRAPAATFDTANRIACRATTRGRHGDARHLLRRRAQCGHENAFPMSDEDWRTVLDTNLNGFYNVLRRIVIAPAAV